MKVFKGLVMVGLFSMFTLFTAVTSANAQLSTQIRVKVPFDFNVGDKKLPAGEYTVSRVSGFSNNTILIDSEDGRAHTFQTTFQTETLDPRSHSSLIFHRYNDQYFLVQIWTAGERVGTQLSRSRGERALLDMARTDRRIPSALSMKTVEVVTDSF